jgi:hypothetical protein
MAAGVFLGVIIFREMKKSLVWMSVALAVGILAVDLTGQVQKTNIPFADAKPILEALRQDLLPAELRGTTAPEIESVWPRWVARRDAEIRRRLERGDEDSVVNFLLFGVTFTKQPRVTERDLDARLANSAAVVRGRIESMIAGIAAPDENERLQLVRDIVVRRGIDPATADGREQARRFFDEGVKAFIEEREAIANRAVMVATKALQDPTVGLSEGATLFQDRGLSSDTTIFIDFAIQSALEAIKSNALIAAGSVRRIGIVGPGLDFTDKREGFDFYPQQTTQPFAVVDSLIRLGLARQDDLLVTTFDLSPRINRHLDAARDRARAGMPYVLQLPRDTSYEWNPLLVKYWEQFGDRIGERVPAVEPPPGVQNRAVRVRPAVVLSVAPADLNVVLQRLEPQAVDERFDLIIATNILVYYDVFEQSLALANVARMLRPGALFLTNTPAFTVPSIPIGLVGDTDVLYSKRDSSRERVFWYRKQ